MYGPVNSNFVLDQKKSTLDCQGPSVEAPARGIIRIAQIEGSGLKLVVNIFCKITQNQSKMFTFPTFFKATRLRKVIFEVSFPLDRPPQKRCNFTFLCAPIVFDIFAEFIRKTLTFFSQFPRIFIFLHFSKTLVLCCRGYHLVVPPLTLPPKGVSWNAFLTTQDSEFSRGWGLLHRGCLKYHK